MMNEAFLEKKLTRLPKAATLLLPGVRDSGQNVGFSASWYTAGRHRWGCDRLSASVAKHCDLRRPAKILS